MYTCISLPDCFLGFFWLVGWCGVFCYMLTSSGDFLNINLNLNPIFPLVSQTSAQKHYHAVVLLMCFDHTLLHASWNFCFAISIQSSNPCSLPSEEKGRLYHNPVSFQFFFFNQETISANIYRWNTGWKMCMIDMSLRSPAPRENTQTTIFWKPLSSSFDTVSWQIQSVFVHPLPSEDIRSKMPTGYFFSSVSSS